MAIQVPPNCDFTLGLRCLDKSVPGTTVWEFVADERFANPAGVLQGGFLSAAIDSALGASVVSGALGRKVYVANTDMRVSFIRAVPIGASVTIRAEVLRSGRSVAFVRALATNKAGELVATASSSYLLKDR